MKIKLFSSLVLVAAALFCLPSSSAEARAHFSFNVGSFFCPPPRVCERYVVEQYSPYYEVPYYMAPAPVIVAPAPRVYREVYVAPARPPVFGGFSFSFGR